MTDGSSGKIATTLILCWATLFNLSLRILHDARVYNSHQIEGRINPERYH